MASVAGAAIFAAATGFGRTARLVEPLPEQIRLALVGMGLGINEVDLSGQRHTSEDDIYAALALDQAGTLLTYDASAARRRIEALAWVETAKVTRILPDRLKVEIRERRPAALWEHDSRIALIDRSGRRLAYLAGGLPNLPRVSGAGAPAAAGQLLAQLAPYQEIAARLEVARRVGERRWSLELAGGVTVHLPADRVGEALQRLSRHDAQSGLIGTGKVVDLRHDGVIAVRGGAPGTSAAAAPLPPPGAAPAPLRSGG